MVNGETDSSAIRILHGIFCLIGVGAALTIFLLIYLSTALRNEKKHIILKRMQQSKESSADEISDHLSAILDSNNDPDLDEFSACAFGCLFTAFFTFLLGIAAMIVIVTLNTQFHPKAPAMLSINIFAPLTPTTTTTTTTELPENYTNNSTENLDIKDVVIEIAMGTVEKREYDLEAETQFQMLPPGRRRKRYLLH